MELMQHCGAGCRAEPFRARLPEPRRERRRRSSWAVETGHVCRYHMRMQDDHDRALAMFRNRVADYPGVGGEFAERWRSWCRTLLSFGGELVVPPLKPEPRLDDLIVGGREFEPPVRVLGLGGDCHANVAKLWIAERCAVIGAGYALYKDGYWRQHSWGLNHDGAVVETKLWYERYLGVAIPAGEPTARFALRNYEGDAQRMLRGRAGRWADIAVALQKKRR